MRRRISRGEYAAYATHAVNAGSHGVAPASEVLTCRSLAASASKSSHARGTVGARWYVTPILSAATYASKSQNAQRRETATGASAWLTNFTVTVRFSPGGARTK